jgi:hypothetical protein
MDLAARPRGGWQIGGPKFGRQQAAFTLEGPPDYFTVTTLRPGAWLVKHFPAEGQKPCCVINVERRPGESDIDALARSDRFVEQRHAQLPATGTEGIR